MAQSRATSASRAGILLGHCHEPEIWVERRDGHDVHQVEEGTVLTRVLVVTHKVPSIASVALQREHAHDEREKKPKHDYYEIPHIL